MAERIKSVKIKQDGNWDKEVPIGTDAKFIDMENGNTLEEEVNVLIDYLDTQISDALNRLY